MRTLKEEILCCLEPYLRLVPSKLDDDTFDFLDEGNDDHHPGGNNGAHVDEHDPAVHTWLAISLSGLIKKFGHQRGTSGLRSWRWGGQGR